MNWINESVCNRVFRYPFAMDFYAGVVHGLRIGRVDDATRNKCGSERCSIGKDESQRADEEVRRN